MINKRSDTLLTFLLLLPHLQGLEISDPGQVVYKDTKISSVVEQEVVLDCGPSLPDIYIWSFTKPGTETIRALLYDFGRGPKLQQLAKDLGDLQIISDSASLSIKELPTAAEGLYTCQALYDSANGAELYYYYVYLRVLVPVSKPYILLNESSADEGSPFWMRCVLNNGTNPIRYVWEQEDQRGLVTTLAGNNSSSIEFTRLSRNHTGWYRCLVRNEVNQELSDRIWLDVFFGPDLPQVSATAYLVTDERYSIMENGNITLACHAPSNPPSRYIWFYNDSEISVGSDLTITTILRRNTGNYTCLAQNMNLNTSSKKIVTLTVYYPPDGTPTCSILPKNNYTDLALTCSWDGGCPPATVYWSPNDNREPLVSDIAQVTRIQPGPETANYSIFICYGSHVALNATKSCTTRVWLPDGEPRCSANSSKNNDHLMLSCSWDGGSPEALLWWASSSGDIQSTPEESSSNLVLHSSSIYNGRLFICNAKHPLAGGSTQCVVKLEVPVLMTQRSVVPVYEGNDVQLACAVSRSYPVTTEITWYNNFKQKINGTTKKYVLEPGPAWFNLTIVKTERPVDSGPYWCSANNAVGRAELSVSLLVMSYPMPPDVTISRLLFSGRERTDVNLEWSVKSSDNLTGFLIERTCDVNTSWQRVAGDLGPRTHSYHITDLDPGVRYAFRVTAVNRRTFGNPSETMSPVPVPVSKPYIILSDTSAEEGTSVWMSCGLGNGTEPIHYVWELERLDGSVTVLSESDRSLFTITRVSRNHTGWYRCLARNEINQQSSNQIWLDVLYGPDLPQIDASAYAVTENGFSMLENGEISLLCRASSNPPSQYVWFFNDSQIYTGPQLSITKILRKQAGNYTCLAKNTHLDAHSERATVLTVYYPPDGVPSCTMFQTNNYTDLRLFCSWHGGYPPAFLKWISYGNEDDRGGFAEVSRVQPGPGTANNSVFTCYGSHIASNTNQSCNSRAWRPHGDPRCLASSSLNNEHLVLSCSWERGSPQALLWWTTSSGDMLSVSKEETNILVLHSNNSYSGKAFVCRSKHPLAVESKQCVLNLDGPVLISQHSSVSVTEGSDAQLTCNLTEHRPAVTEIIWYNSTNQRVGYNVKKYLLRQEAGWSSLTVQGTDGTVDSGQYRCSATNAVGSAEIPIMLLVMMSVSKPQIVLSDTSPVEGSSLWMRCTVEKGTGPINYTWEQESLTGRVTTLAKGNSSLVNITGVTRNHTGWIRCLARNSVNQQLSDRLWLSVLFGPDLPQIDVVAFSTTDRGYTALEYANVSLTCSATANPPGQYIWFYNNSQIYTGPQLNITKILRVQAGYYACLVLNTRLNTRSKQTTALSVYYPPDGAPLCSITAMNDCTDLALSCSWVGGFPPVNLSWGPYVNGGNTQAGGSITLIQPGSETLNNSVFTCYGSHVALRAPQSCSSKAWLPYGEPRCFAYATRNNEYLMLSCTWDGGFPRALLWWSSSAGDVQGVSEENTNILVLQSSDSYSGKAFTCNAKHPLSKETKQCVLKLEAPVLMTQRSVVSVYEGNDVQLTCILSKNYPAVTEITWYNNMKQKVGDTPQKYVLQQAAAWVNLTVRETDSVVDSGQYWCSAANAVGGAEIPILLLVMRYPMPPNVTITKLMYSHHQKTDVDMDWQIQTDGELTGFFIELQKLHTSTGPSEDVLLWQKVPAGLESTARSYQITGLDPSGRYAFRVTAVNHRTTGHPSQVKRPANPVFRAYPAVIGAAVGGMILATVATALLLGYVLRNRNTSPRLHDLVFGRHGSQSRENISVPEDEKAKSFNTKQMPE